MPHEQSVAFDNACKVDHLHTFKQKAPNKRRVVNGCRSEETSSHCGLSQQQPCSPTQEIRRDIRKNCEGSPEVSQPRQSHVVHIKAFRWLVRPEDARKKYAKGQQPQGKWLAGTRCVGMSSNYTGPKASTRVKARNCIRKAEIESCWEARYKEGRAVRPTKHFKLTRSATSSEVRLRGITASDARDNF